MARDYSGLPHRIFGLKCSQHRAWKIRLVTLHFGCGIKRSTKERLLQRLAILERNYTASENQKAIITDWFACNTSQTIAEALAYGIDPSKFVISEREQKAILDDKVGRKVEDSVTSERGSSSSVCGIQRAHYKPNLDISDMFDRNGRKRNPRKSVQSAWSNSTTRNSQGRGLHRLVSMTHQYVEHACLLVLMLKFLITPGTRSNAPNAM